MSDINTLDWAAQVAAGIDPGKALESPDMTGASPEVPTDQASAPAQRRPAAQSGLEAVDQHVGQQNQGFRDLTIAREKLASGQILTPAETDLIGEHGFEDDKAGPPIQILRWLGRNIVSPGVLPTALTAIGGTVGSLGGPVGTTIGATAGSVAGTELNFALGLENESKIARTLAVIAPNLGALVGRVGRSVIRATPAGQAIRGELSSELAKNAAKLALKTPGQEVISQGYKALRATGQTINLQEVGTALDNLDPVLGKRIINTLRKMGKSTRDALDNITSPPEGILTQKAINPDRFNVAIGDLMDMRQAAYQAKQAAFLRKGAGDALGNVEGKELGKLTSVIDDVINKSAQSGDQAANGLKELNYLQRVQWAQDELNDVIRASMKTQTMGKHAVNTFDINKVDTLLAQARDALAKGADHKYGELAKMLDEVGDLKSFTKDLESIRKLSPVNNPVLVGQSFGMLSRAVNFAADTAGFKLLGEIMLNKTGRGMFLKLIRATNGVISPPILATAAAYGRAATGQPLDEVSAKVIDTLYKVRERQMTPQTPRGGGIFSKRGPRVQ